MFSQLLARTNRLCLEPIVSNLHTCQTLEAARKGTRMKREALKRAMKRKKIEVVKKEFIPEKKRRELEKLKMLQNRPPITLEPIDNVYARVFFKEQIHNVSSALVYHRQFCHETSYNQPNALVYAHLDLSLKLDKKNRYIPAFSGMLSMPYMFDTEEEKREILVITENHEVKEKIFALGIENVVGADIIKQIKAGNLNMEIFDYVICDVHLLPEIVGLRAALKKNYPSVSNGTAVIDVEAAVKKFQTGVEYSIVKSKYDPNHATVKVKIGRLKMADEEIETNLELFLNDLAAKQPKTRTKSMIDKVQITCPPCPEIPTINHEQYLVGSQASVSEKVADAV